MRVSVLLALMPACLMGIPASAAERPEAQIETFSSVVVEVPVVQKTIMPEFAQANPAWSNVLFHEQRTLGAKGCAVFSAFIFARLSGYAGDPFSFTQSLRVFDSFDDRGRLRWDRVTIFAPLDPERLTDQGDAAFNAAKLELQNGNYVALQLRTPWTREHWVAAIDLAGDDIEIIDPAGGVRGLFQDKYEIEHIQGMTVFRKIPDPFWLAAAL
ncbi:MAG TPA: hypothetical protein VJA87_00320 [Candidatus Paceibacterota bacterium]